MRASRAISARRAVSAAAWAALRAGASACSAASSRRRAAASSLAAAAYFTDLILDGDEEALERYLNALRAGGSDDPYQILLDAGVDLATPEPYRVLVERMERTMDEMEAILATIEN